MTAPPTDLLWTYRVGYLDLASDQDAEENRYDSTAATHRLWRTLAAVQGAALEEMRVLFSEMEADCPEPDWRAASPDGDEYIWEPAGSDVLVRVFGARVVGSAQ